jgi:CTP:molybdopterin cytidylyltransferase MocA
MPLPALPDTFCPSAVVLAAGAGSRLGRRPKCLLELDGVALVRRLLLALSEAGAGRIVVVLGHHADQVAPALHGLPATLVHNPEPGDSLVSSQRLGLAALGEAPGATIVALADQPLLDAGDLRALLAAHQARPRGTQVTVPRVAGERGNPVVLGAAVRSQVLAGPSDFGCRQWQQAHPAAVAHFDTDNDHYRIDIDSPADIDLFTGRTGRALRWPAALRDRAA